MVSSCSKWCISIFSYLLFHWWQPVMGFQAQWGLQALGAAGWEKQPTNLLTLKSRALPLIMLKVKFAITSRWSRQQSECVKNHNPRHQVLRLCYMPSLTLKQVLQFEIVSTWQGFGGRLACPGSERIRKWYKLDANPKGHAALCVGTPPCLHEDFLLTPFSGLSEDGGFLW